MDKRFRDRILKQLQELSNNDGDRLMQHLEQSEALERSSGAESQARYADRMREQGYKSARFWIDPETLEALRERYPGDRGGVDWESVCGTAATSDPILADVIRFLDHGMTLDDLKGLKRDDLFHFRELLRHWMELADARL